MVVFLLFWLWFLFTFNPVYFLHVPVNFNMGEAATFLFLIIAAPLAASFLVIYKPALQIKPLQPSSQSDTTPVSSKAASSSSSTPALTNLSNNSDRHPSSCYQLFSIFPDNKLRLSVGSRGTQPHWNKKKASFPG